MNFSVYDERLFYFFQTDNTIYDKYHEITFYVSARRTKSIYFEKKVNAEFECKLEADVLQ